MTKRTVFQYKVLVKGLIGTSDFFWFRCLNLAVFAERVVETENETLLFHSAETVSELSHKWKVKIVTNVKQKKKKKEFYKNSWKKHWRKN